MIMKMASVVDPLILIQVARPENRDVDDQSPRVDMIALLVVRRVVDLDKDHHYYYINRRLMFDGFLVRLGGGSKDET